MEFSRLMLGTVQFGLNYGIANSAGKPSYEIVRKIISTAYDHGVNCLDTAAGYGDSEEILGRVLDELNLKNKMLLISKVPNLIQHGFSERDAEKFIVDSVERSLTKLGIESLAVGMFHSEQDIKYLGIMKKLEKQGLINGVGISLDSNRYCNEVITAGIKYVQIPYNVLDQRFDEFLSKALESGITIFTRSIYLQGLLLMPEKAITQPLQSIIPIRQKLSELATEHGIEMAELCMRFVLNNPSIKSIVTGVDNSEQLKHNLQIMKKGALPSALHKKIKSAVPLLPETLIRPSLWNKTTSN